MTQRTLRIKANCKNIKNIFIDQAYPVTLQCTGCNEQHPNPVEISADSIRRNDKNNPVNMQVKCHGCGRLMEASISGETRHKHVHWLDFTHTQSEIYYLSEKENDFYLVSYIKTNGCLVLAVENLSINVLAEDDSLFMDINVEDGKWSGKDKRNNLVEFKDLKWDLFDEKDKRKPKK
ncbi:hypothetical protein COBT_003048 [Conglomerata obtusa]